MVVKYLVERSSAVYSPREKLNRCVGVLLLMIVPLINYPCIKTISVSQPVTCEAETKQKKSLSALDVCTVLTKLNGKTKEKKFFEGVFFFAHLSLFGIRHSVSGHKKMLGLSFCFFQIMNTQETICE